MDILNSIFSYLSEDIAIDLGTANIRVMVKGNDEIICEPSMIAINKNNEKILAVGEEARKMVGRTPSNVVAVQPLRRGVVSDFDATEAMIRYYIKKAQSELGGTKLLKPRVVVGVPSLITEVEINAVIDAVKSAGGRKVYVVEEPVAAAIGSDLKIEEAGGTMVVDIGGGTTDIAVISLGGMIVDNTIRVAGDEMDKSIVEYIKNKYNLLIGVKMAEDLKKKIGSVIPRNKIEKMEIKGRDLVSGLPKGVEISSVEVSEALESNVDSIHSAIKEAIDKTPPEIVSDLLTNGITLTGGGANLIGLDKYLSNRLKLPVYISEKPIFSVVRGITRLLDNIELLEKVQVKDLILK